jgi:hypothetical protein
MTWLTGKAAKAAGFQGVKIVLPDGREFWPKWVRAANPEEDQLEVLLVLGGSDPAIALFRRLQPREPGIASTLRVTGVAHSRTPLPSNAEKIYWDGAHWLNERGGLLNGAPTTFILAEQEV